MKKVGKLKLNRETIAALSSRVLGQVAGGRNNQSDQGHCPGPSGINTGCSPQDSCTGGTTSTFL